MSPVSLGRYAKFQSLSFSLYILSLTCFLSLALQLSCISQRVKYKRLEFDASFAVRCECQIGEFGFLLQNLSLAFDAFRCTVKHPIQGTGNETLPHFRSCIIQVRIYAFWSFFWDTHLRISQKGFSNFLFLVLGGLCLDSELEHLVSSLVRTSLALGFPFYFHLRVS